MSRKALQLGFCLCLLALTALSAFPAQAIEAQQFGYSETGIGGTMEQACENARQELRDRCALLAPITTHPGRCLPLKNLQGEIIGYVCTCEATTLACFNPQ